MKPTDKFTIQSKVTGTMKVKTNKGRTIPFVLLNAPLAASLKLSLNALGLLARIESLTGSNGGSIDALYLSRHSPEPMETLLAALVELQANNLLKREKQEREKIEMNLGKKKAAKTDTELAA